MPQLETRKLCMGKLTSKGKHIVKAGNHPHTNMISKPARISFRFDGEIKSFTDKQKLREFSTTKPALQQMLKELL